MVNVLKGKCTSGGMVKVRKSDIRAPRGCTKQSPNDRAGIGIDGMVEVMSRNDCIEGIVPDIGEQDVEEDTIVTTSPLPVKGPNTNRPAQEKSPWGQSKPEITPQPSIVLTVLTASDGRPASTREKTISVDSDSAVKTEVIFPCNQVCCTGGHVLFVAKGIQIIILLATVGSSRTYHFSN